MSLLECVFSEDEDSSDVLTTLIKTKAPQTPSMHTGMHSHIHAEPSLFPIPDLYFFSTSFLSSSNILFNLLHPPWPSLLKASNLTTEIFFVSSLPSPEHLKFTLPQCSSQSPYSVNTAPRNMYCLTIQRNVPICRKMSEFLYMQKLGLGHSASLFQH